MHTTFHSCNYVLQLVLIVSSSRCGAEEKVFGQFQGFAGYAQLGDIDLFFEFGVEVQQKFVAALVVEVVDMFEEDLVDPGADEGAEAVHAGGQGAVGYAAFDGDALPGGVGDGVDFSVNGAGQVAGFDAGHLVLWLPPIALFFIGAVPGSGRRAVVAGGEDAAVANDDGADRAGEAGGAGRRQFGQDHEVFVPGGPVFTEFLAQGGGFFIFAV
jgi:hypothetical protein